jgi:hypothetical protein
VAEYVITADTEMGYGVKVSAPDRLLYVRGFMTEHDARAWIVEQQIAEETIAEAKGSGSNWYE